MKAQLSGSESERLAGLTRHREEAEDDRCFMLVDRARRDNDYATYLPSQES